MGRKKKKKRSQSALAKSRPSRAVNATRGSTLWTYNYYRSNMLTNLLNDLIMLESTGLEDELCHKIHESLSFFSNASTEVPSGGFLTGPIYKDIDDFIELYDEWNEIAGEADWKTAERRQLHQKLKKQRQKITNKARKLQYELDNNLDRMIMEATYKVISDLITLGPDLFKNISGALTEYFKRGGTI